MAKLPNRVSPGPRLTAAWLNQLLDYVRAITPKSGVNIMVKETSGGTIISGQKSKGVGSSGGVTFYKITTTGANTCTVKSLSDENGVLTETDIPGTFPCAFPCVATGKVVPTGNKFLAFKVGTIYVADPLRWLKV